MKVYVINLIILIVIGLIAERHVRYKAARIFFCSYSWLQLTILAAVRWGIGLDFNQYYNTFFAVSNASGWAEILQRREEIGFLIFNRLASYITGNIIVYLFLYYGLMFGLLMLYVYKYSEIKWSTVAAFIVFDYFAMSLCFMRQSMAMVIGLFALEMIKRRKWYWAVLITLLASLFHVSALILLVCLAVSYLDFSKRRVWMTAVILSVVLYVGCDFILEHVLVGPFAKYADYLESQFMAGNHVLVVFYPLFVFGLVVYFRKQLCKEDKDFKNLIPILFLGTVLSIMSTKHYIIERMALYMIFYNIRVVAQVLALFKNRAQKWNYQLAVYSAVVISFGAFAFGIMTDRYGICPYQLNENYLYRVEFFKDVRHDAVEQAD